MGSLPFLSSESATRRDVYITLLGFFHFCRKYELHGVSKLRGIGYRGPHGSLSCFIGVSQNMAPNLNSVKNLFVFLGKSVFALLEVMVFTFIPRPQKSVAGEIVLITGSGSGLGRLLALKFARLGSVLVLWDVSKEGNEETSKMACEAGAAKVYTYTCDCSRKEEVYRVADQVNLGCLLFPVGSENAT